MIINQILESDRLEDIFILSRYFYRTGEPIIEDYKYDALVNYFKEKGTMTDYLNRTYDDDPIPTDLLMEIGENPVNFLVNKDRAGLFTYFNEDKSLSIDSTISYQEAYRFFINAKRLSLDLNVSLKLDGINTKSLFLDGKLGITLSRGRHAANSFDFTDQVVTNVPIELNDVPKELRVFAEAYVEPDYLPVLRNKYDNSKYKTAKSSALSLLRVKHSVEDYKHLHVCAFFAEGLADTVSESFSKLDSLGFDTAPHYLVTPNDIPDDYDAFCKWLDDTVFQYFGKFRQDGVPADGVVVEIDDLNYIGVNTNQYTSRQLALKFGPFAYQKDVGVISEMVWKQGRVLACTKVNIEPITTYDMCTAECINCFNPAILIAEDLCVGKQVRFEKNSGAVNILVRDKSLNMGGS